MKRAFTLVEVLIVVAVILVLAAFLLLVFDRMTNGPRRAKCQLNLKEIGLGFLQYERDYDEKLPPARVTSSTGWADVLQPYVKSTTLFQCPSGASRTTEFSTDYFYNRRLAGVVSTKIQNPASIIMIGDGQDNAPTWNSWTRLPAAVATNPKSPARRHLDGANYGFADGHAKYLTPQELSQQFEWSPLSP